MVGWVGWLLCCNLQPWPVWQKGEKPTECGGRVLLWLKPPESAQLAQQPAGGVSAHSLFRDAANLVGVRDEVRSGFESEFGAPSGVTLGAFLELPHSDTEFAMVASNVDGSPLRALKKPSEPLSVRQRSSLEDQLPVGEE
eukprot:3978281-Amphidinium_carterae.1